MHNNIIDMRNDERVSQFTNRLFVARYVIACLISQDNIDFLDKLFWKESERTRLGFQMSVLFQPLNLIRTIFENNVAFVKIQFPWLNNHNIIRTKPKFSFQSSGNAAIAFFSVQTRDHHFVSAEPLLNNSYSFFSSRERCASHFLLFFVGIIFFSEILGHKNGREKLFIKVGVENLSQIF